MSEIPNFDELVECFEMLDDWEERYSYLIDIGRNLPLMDDALKSNANKVQGCTSQVWMVMLPNAENQVDFLADSDAHIVRGLIALLYSVYNGKSYQDVKSFDIEGFFEKLGLSSHLSPNRRNGFFSMVERLKRLASDTSVE